MIIQPFHNTAGGPSSGPLPPKGDCTTPFYQHNTQSQTPPSSNSGSPRVKIEGVMPGSSEFTTLPGLLHLPSPSQDSQCTLPSLGEFVQGVEALVQTYGRHNPRPTESSFLGPMSFNTRPYVPVQHQQTRPSLWTARDNGPEEAMRHPSCSSSRRGINTLGQYALAGDQGQQPLHSYASPESSYNPMMSSPTMHSQSNMDCYPSPPPEGEGRHINQKYTTEEGDYIIYAWHDKKMKWQRIKQEFATRFGRTPERTVQGLQAWYYRMNQRIPLWDQDGWLLYDNPDDLEPKCVSIKCRERDSQDKPMEPLGLAQRYPERAMNYSWVDPELKLKARDWAEKRSRQYYERRERRRRKEQRRIKL